MSQNELSPIECGFNARLCRQRPGRGFTLIELLVVIAIIAILASILFPVFARARENGRKAACMSNLKQFGLAAIQYFDDNDGLVFGEAGNGTGVSIQTLINPYIKNTQIWFCPDQSTTEAAKTYGYAFNEWYWNYYYPRTGYEWRSPIGQPLSGFTNPPALCIMMGDARTDVRDNYQSFNGIITVTDSNGGTVSNYNVGLTLEPPCYPWDDGIAGGGINGCSYAAYIGRHMDGCNFCYYDGHVKWQNLSQVLSNTATDPSGTFILPFSAANLSN